MRKIIQVSTCGVENTMGTQCNYVVIALCDDGTVWLNRNVDSHWDELPAIPQPEKKESKPVMPVGFLDHGGIFYSYREKIKDGTELYAIPPAPEGDKP